MGIEITTKLRIAKPAEQVFEALVDPAQMAGYWFSSGSSRWDAGKTVTLRYDEYGAEVDIRVLTVDPGRKIVFQSAEPGDVHIVTITLTETEDASTVAQVTEAGWKDDEDLHTLLDNKEGWVYVLTCLKAYLEFGVTNLRAALVK